MLEEVGVGVSEVGLYVTNTVEFEAHTLSTPRK